MISYEEFKKVEMRVGTVLEARDHPDADRLYVLRVDMGDEERELVAGLKQHCAPDELLGRQVVVAANIAPAVIRGVTSRGMVLAAGDAEALAVVTVAKKVKNGSPVR